MCVVPYTVHVNNITSLNLNVLQDLESPGAILANGRGGRETTLLMKQKCFLTKNLLFYVFKPILMQ